MSATLPAISREYVYVEGVVGFLAGEEADPTALPVEVALVVRDTLPGDSDWVAAEWHNATTVRFLLGPGGVLTKPKGDYTTWVRITGAVEQPTRAVGAVMIRP